MVWMKIVWCCKSLFSRWEKESNEEWLIFPYRVLHKRITNEEKICGFWPLVKDHLKIRSNILWNFNSLQKYIYVSMCCPKQQIQLSYSDLNSCHTLLIFLSLIEWKSWFWLTKVTLLRSRHAGDLWCISYYSPQSSSLQTVLNVKEGGKSNTCLRFHIQLLNLIRFLALVV